MSIPKEESKIEIKPDDIVIRPIIPDKEEKKDNPLEKIKEDNDLPF